MDDLNAAANLYPDFCNEWYALGVFLHIISATNTQYTNVSNGYDDKFNAYVRYIKDMVPEAIDSYMGVDYSNNRPGPGFSCTLLLFPISFSPLQVKSLAIR